jgi:glycosyltransferase involved in cell wall biosynthesis
VNEDFALFPEECTVEHIIVCGENAEYAKEGNQQYIYSSPQGIYNAMNTGLNSATGEWVWFLNAGDECMSGISPKLLQVINSCAEDISVIKAGVESISEYGSATVFGKIASPHQGTFYRKSILTSVGGYREDYKMISDRIMFDLLFFEKIKMYQCNLVVAKFYENGISSTKNGKRQICKESFRYAMEYPISLFRWYRYVKSIYLCIK